MRCWFLRVRGVLVVVTIVLTAGVIFYVHRSTFQGKRQFCQKGVPHCEVNEITAGQYQKTNDNVPDMRNADRIHHLQTACTSVKPHLNDITSPTKVCYSPKYNFYFCKVPKIGSTFWIKVFEILEHGAGYLNEILYKARNDLHGTWSRGVEVKGNPNNSVMAMMTRDPYSRLFSAYIDKAFIPSRNRLSPKPCKQPTFQEFFNHIIVSRTEVLDDDHINLVSSVCNPCVIEPSLLLKQETFLEDVMFTMNTLGIEEASKHAIADMMQTLHVSTNVPGIVKAIYFKAKRKGQQCAKWVDVARATWESFQLQGYVGDEQSFPLSRFTSNRQFSNDSFLTELLLEIIREHPLTKAESQLQRRRAIIKAYSSISNKTFRSIQEIYKLDFKLFNYSNVPPHKRQ